MVLYQTILIFTVLCLGIFNELTIACQSGKTQQAAVAIGNVGFAPSSGTKFVRCKARNAARFQCHATKCDAATEKQLPQLQSFASIQSCESYIGYALCYNPIAWVCVSDYYGCNSMTHQIQWPNTVTWFASESSCYSAVPAAVGAWIRCNSSGIPVCRYQQCLTGEDWLTTPPGRYDTETQCKNNLFFARPCYRSRGQVGSYYYYDQSVVFDTTGGQCNTGNLLLTTEYFGNETDYLAANDALAYYNAQLPLEHYLCKVNGVPVCRPYMPSPNPGPCASGERQYANFPITSWPTLGDCDSQRYWGLVCYNATTEEPYFYIYINVSPNATCKASDVALTYLFADSEASLMYKLNNYYTSTLTLAHYRCSVNGQPVCRPKMGTNNFCAPNEEQLTFTTTSSWNNLGACLRQRYWGVGCYIANTDVEPYYQYTTVWDTPIGIGCPSINAVQIGLMNYSYSPTDLTAKLTPSYTSSTPITHFRCNINVAIPVCRPSLNGSSDGCGQLESRIVSTPTIAWPNLAACSLQLYWEAVCYNPTVTYPYFSLYSSTDANNLKCNTGDLFIQYLSDPTETGLLTYSLQDFYSETTPRTHYRCINFGGEPICRPDLGTGNACALNEDRLSAAGVNFSWNSLGACNAQRFWGIGCYTANTQAEPYYNYSAVWDTKLGFSCPINSVQLTNPITNSTNEDLQNAILTYYTASTQLTHIRCVVGNVPVCRPILQTGSSDGCGQNERRLMSTLTTTYPNLGDCTSNLYSYLMCYNEQYPSNYTCTSDLNGCSGSIYRVIGSGSADTDENAATACWNMKYSNSVLWSRCQVLYPNNGNAAICRPGSNGAGCLGGESLLQQNLPLASCMGNLYIAYYAPTQYYYNKVLDNADYPTMTYWNCITQPFYSTLSWIALAADFAVYSDCTSYNPTFWFRCHTTSLVSYVTCRPYQNSITCNSNEYQNTSSLYTSPESCLKDAVATSYTFRTCTNTTDNSFVCTAAGTFCVAGTVETNDGRYYFRSDCN